jgi:hypothetical protein
MKKEIYAGLGLGLLIGTIIGLSITEVTGIVLGALTSLLTAFFGLRTSREGETGNQIVIGTFSFTRTHNSFTPSLENEIKEYKMAFFDTSEIKKIILFKQLGLIPQGYTFSKDAIQKNRNSVLMAGEGKALYLCDAIYDNSTLDEIKKAFDNSGGKYNEIENKLSNVISDSAKLHNTLLFFKNMICEQQK